MSPRTKRNRTLLLSRTALLVLCYALPLGGLALFFVMTGLRSRIALAERERYGVRYIRELVEIHDHAVQEISGWRPDRASDDLEAELTRLEELEKELAPQLFPLAAAQGQRGSGRIAEQLHAIWDEARQEPALDAGRREELTRLVGELDALIANTSDAAGLTLSPDLETEYVTDLAAFALPAHLERLLQMHEQLGSLDPAAGPAARSQVSGVFFRQLEKDTPRLARSVQLALEGDAHSTDVSARFQREYPQAASAFLDSMRRLSAALDPRTQGSSGFAGGDETLRSAYAATMEFWRVSATQLDLLLVGQIEHARRQEAIAVGLAAVVILTLVPLTWLYFRRYIRPLIQDLIDEVHEAAQEAVKAKNQFLAMMSHEIRTPMNGVVGFSHLLADTKLDEQQRDFVRTITASGESLLTVINDILDYTKLEADRVELESRPVLLRDLIEDVLDLLSTTAGAKKIELISWIEPDVPEAILTDPTRLRQVLLNLAGNAVKFTAEGHVELTVSRQPGPEPARIVFHVRDTGIGIPANRLDRLFKPFSQVDSSTTRTHGGTGLGLVISQRLVTAMGGEIKVESEPGRGTDFYFSLPAHLPDPQEAAQLQRPVPDEEIARVLRDCRILVVDDYEANRSLFLRMLEPHGAVVVAVESADRAMRLLATQAFELGIIDYRMPVMDGVALAEKIAGKFPPRRLILVSSVYLTPGETPPGLFAAIIVKPIRNRKFLLAVTRTLEGERAESARSTGAPSAAPAAPPLGQSHPLRILAVDDNPVNLKVISMTLAALGYTPAVADGGARALERLRAEPFDLVLMDVQMPEIDGHEATRRLRAGEAGPLNRHARVLALTAGVTAEEREACRAAGMDDFAAKPVSRAVLVEKLTAAAGAEKTQ
ncbi:MAG TPA: response regulator [Opitutaceae bacterium]|nr:response regulator [Lacunisphaera sp.]HWA09079.1 response regulator [Opitutaceae bacterium]